MKLKIAVTGGGTGGHIYPALEVAYELKARGAELIYIGSLRGQEARLATEAGFEFFGLPALPLLSMRTLAGWRGVAALLRSTMIARKLLVRQGVNAVFGTGGYGAAPVIGAARNLGIPYVLHESNSIPGRTNRLFAAKARAISCVFHRTLIELPTAIRTGQPIRVALRKMAQKRDASEGLILVTGGSQGSLFLNEMLPKVARLGHGERWIHATGPTHYESVVGKGLPEGYEAAAYLDTDSMASAYQKATVAVGRSGGTLAEYALFGLPSVLVPLPTSADNHQLHNAEEFAALGAATLVKQEDATAEILWEVISGWLSDSDRRQSATAALQNWDVPDATARITSLVMGT